jgi:hypothetical protein
MNGRYGLIFRPGKTWGRAFLGDSTSAVLGGLDPFDEKPLITGWNDKSSIPEAAGPRMTSETVSAKKLQVFKIKNIKNLYPLFVVAGEGQQFPICRGAYPDIFPDPEGDIALSPDGRWFVNGHTNGDRNYYTVYRRGDGVFVRSAAFYKGRYGGDIQIDPTPRWNRSNDAVLVPGISENMARQMFIIRIITDDRQP